MRGDEARRHRLLTLGIWTWIDSLERYRSSMTDTPATAVKLLREDLERLSEDDDPPHDAPALEGLIAFAVSHGLMVEGAGDEMMSPVEVVDAYLSKLAVERGEKWPTEFGEARGAAS